MPSKQEALDLSVILHAADNKLRQPVGLEQQLLQHMSMDEEVGQSMVQLLQVTDLVNYSLVQARNTLHEFTQDPSLSDGRMVRWSYPDPQAWTRYWIKIRIGCSLLYQLSICLFS